MSDLATQVEQGVGAELQGRDATVRSRKKTLTSWCVLGLVNIWERLQPVLGPPSPINGDEPSSSNSSGVKLNRCSQPLPNIWKPPEHPKRKLPCARGIAI